MARIKDLAMKDIGIRLLACIGLISMIPYSSIAQYTDTYIRKYTPTVVSEMERTGIPASIKMAQAVLESGSGRSTLARQSNNHFGIKCGKNWTGAEVYREDDDYRNGLLIRSCFRAYDDPSDSFMAHSEFLMRNKRYATLWDLDPMDYRGWANGLKKAGYATDPKYPQKLITVIEKYELYLLDQGIISVPQEELIAINDRPDITQHTETSRTKVIATAGPSTPDQSSGYHLVDGYYTLKPGDEMLDIAAHYRMNLKELYFRNRLSYGDTPQPGQKLAITKYIHFKKTPKTMSTPADPEVLFSEKITLSSL